MPDRATDCNALTAQAIAALQRGDMGGARKLFEQAIASGGGGAFVWLGLAAACRGLGDRPGTQTAIDKVLAIEPDNLRALVMKADLFAESGDDTAAASFYGAAIHSAGARRAALTPELEAGLRRAQAMQQRYRQRYIDYLHARLAQRGFDANRSSRRFTQSLDLLTGNKRLYLQQPRTYYFPELPQVQYYERSAFPWLAPIEAATEVIRDELIGVLDEGRGFVPYVEGQENRPARDYQGLLGNPNWSAFYLWKDGRKVADNADRCPRTLSALESAPLCDIAGRAPSIFFSLLKPGTHIPPHTGHFNARLICHLPLIVPDRCALRVGNETRHWIEGQTLIFDDTIEHEAWNRGDRLRVVLIFEIWRPELSGEERELVRALFEAIDTYKSAKPAC